MLLAKRRDGGRAPVAPNVAPGNRASRRDAALHAAASPADGGPRPPGGRTSGNLSDEPICTDEAEAVERLGGIADLFLVHDRPIVRHVDDSIVRVMLGRELVLRRARGYAPLPVRRRLADAAHARRRRASEEHRRARRRARRCSSASTSATSSTSARSEAFRGAIARPRAAATRCEPEAVVADAHPDYASTAFARGTRPAAAAGAAPHGARRARAWPRTS